MKKFNINDDVKVKLNEEGLKVWKKANFYNELQKDENGYYTFQFWDFMNIFGEHIYLGSNCLFENNSLFFNEENLHDTN